MQKTEEFEIDWKGKKEKVIILQMGYAVKCDFRELFIETQMIGKVPKIMIHPFRMKIQSDLYGDIKLTLRISIHS